LVDRRHDLAFCVVVVVVRPIVVLKRTMSRAPTSSGRSQNPSAPSSGIPYGHVPAYLPGSASLVEELDQPLMVVLRDGRHLVGVSANKWYAW
jgi:hypothetical protein